MVCNAIVMLLYIIIGLALLELGKFYLEGCVMEPVFWLMRLGCTKRNAKKLAYAG